MCPYLCTYASLVCLGVFVWRQTFRSYQEVLILFWYVGECISGEQLGELRL